MGKYDLEFFLKTYFPKKFKKPFGNHHKKYLANIQHIILNDGCQAIAMPRGSGKSTIEKGSVPWALGYGHRQPAENKMEHKGCERLIPVGPKAQAILGRYILKAEFPEAFLFSPKVGEATRKSKLRAERKTKVQPSQLDRSKLNPRKQPQDCYSTSSYRRAIHEAATKAAVEKWGPNRLRHSRLTEIRKKYGLEAAQIIGGHAKADVTQVYAERDLEKAIKVAKEIG